MSKEGQWDTAALGDWVVWDVLPTARLPGWRIYTHICVRTQKHCHLSLSLGPSLVSVWTMCLSRYPTKLAGGQHEGLSPHRLGRGAPPAPVSYSWTWVAQCPIFFCLLRPFRSSFPSTGPCGWWACPSTLRIIFCLNCNVAWMDL